MKWKAIVGDPRELYRAAKATYHDTFKAKIATAFSMSVLIVPGWIWLSSQPISDQSDYSVVAVVLILVGVAAITMLNYRLILRKELVGMRSRRLLRELRREYESNLLDKFSEGSPLLLYQDTEVQTGRG